MIARLVRNIIVIGLGIVWLIPIYLMVVNAFVPAGKFDERPLGELLDELRAVRAGTIALVQGVPGEAWSRRGKASDAVVSARALAYIVVGHFTHHARVLRERYLVSSASGVAAGRG